MRASIGAIGCLVPVLKWHGTTVDGRRREAICEELGIVPPLRVLGTLRDVCTALWPLHPDRALAFAREHAGGHAGLAPTLRELAALCSVSVSAIAVRLERPKQGNRGTRRTHSTRSVLIKFWAEPQFKHYVRLVGASLGMDLSSTIRAAAWEFVQKYGKRPPTEGTDRSPSPEWVKRPERRRLKRGS